MAFEPRDALAALHDTLGDDTARLFDGSAFRQVLQDSGLGALAGRRDIGNLDDLSFIASHLPGALAQPDATGEVATGSAAIPRAEAYLAAGLAATPRIVAALGPGAVQVDFAGQAFAIAGRYTDAESGFSGLHLAAADGTQVFAIDGLEVGSRADEVAAASLGRLQVESAAFQAFVADAGAAGQAGQPLLFAGASLGGALSQVAAYETAAALHAGGHDAPGAVQLVTIDSLGGRDAAEAENGALDPQALALITALNIRTEGDIVSRIGSHIGATLTLPALDASGQEVHLAAADAHVNIASLLQNLSSDARYEAGVAGAPGEISGFAAASNATAEEVMQLWRLSGAEDPGAGGPLQLPGIASLDATGTLWSLDADSDGSIDLTVHLAQPLGRAPDLMG